MAKSVGQRVRRSAVTATGRLNVPQSFPRRGWMPIGEGCFVRVGLPTLD